MAENTRGTSQGPSAQPQHGRTMADEEVERVEQKRLRGDVLDPIALTDPMGQSVERVIMRVGVTVVAILIAGILLAQVACKNIQLAAIPDLTNGVTADVVENALTHGITWSGDIVRFSNVEKSEVGVENGTVTVTEDATSARALETAVSGAIARSTALAMNVFRDEAIDELVYIVKTHVSADDGTFAAASGAPVGEAFRVVWTRSEADGTQFDMRLEGAGLADILQSTSNQVDQTPGVQLGGV